MTAAAPAQPAPAPAVAAAPKTRGRPRTTAPAQVPVAASTAQPVVRDVAVMAPVGNGMLAKMLTPSAPVQLAAASVAAIAEAGGGEPNIFPTLSLLGGDTGGIFDLDQMNQEHSDDDLPVGRKPIHGVLIGYRMLALCWPKAYNKNAKITPKWRAHVSGDAAEDADLLTQAFRAYQFRTRLPPGSREADPWDQVGHPAACVELLVFTQTAGLICLRSTWTYDSFTSTSKEVAGAWPDGSIKPIPVLIEPITEHRESKNQKWDEHYIKIAHHMSAETQAAWSSLIEFNQQASADADLNQALTDWSTSALTTEQRDTLANIAAFR